MFSILHSDTIKKGSLYTIFSFFNSGIGFVLLIIIAKYIDPDGYGKINLFNTLITIISFVVCLNTSGILSVNYFRMDKSDFEKSVNSVNNITCLCSIILLVIVVIFYKQISNYTGLNLTHQIYALLVSALTVYFNIILNIWRVEEKIYSYGALSCLSAVLNFVFTIGFVVSLHQGWVGRINANVLLSIVLFVISIYFLLSKGYLKSKPSTHHYKDALLFGVPLIPHAVSGWLRQGLDRIFLNAYQSSAIVGLFSFSYNFANLIILIGTAFNATNSVYIYKILSEGKEDANKKLRSQTIMVISLFALITIMISVGAYIFIPVLFPEYQECKAYIFLQCIAAFFYCVYLQFVNYLFYFKRTKVLMNITFFVSLLHSFVSYWLSHISVSLTLWTGAVSSFLIALLVFLYSRRFYKVI